MFVYYFSRIRLPFEAVAPRFKRRAGGWIKDAIAESWTGTSPTVHCGSIVEREEAIVVPVRIEDGWPFSRLDADLELAMVHQDLCQVTLSGSYESASRTDAVRSGRVNHQLAEGYVRDMVEHVSDWLTANEATSPTG